MTVIEPKSEIASTYGASLGDRLRFGRERRGLAPVDVSKLLGVSENTLKRWESGKAAPRANRMPIIASTLNIHMRWLMSGQGDISEANDPGPTPRDLKLLEEIQSIKQRLKGSAERVAGLEVRLKLLASKTTRADVDADA